MTSLALGSKLSSINARTRVAKAVANFLTGLPQKLVRTTRAGLATCIGPDGTLQWGPHNLLAEGCNNLDNTGAAPVTNASLTTTTVVFTAANGSYWYKATPATLPVGTVLILQALASCSVPRTVCFRAANGTTGSANEAKTNVALTQTPQVVWVTLTVTTAAPISWGIDNRSLVGATDTGVTGVITVTNVMCENVTGTNRTTPSDYVDSTVKNRLGYSNDFANAAWTKTGASVYPAATLPDGTPMSLLSEDATTGFHRVSQIATVPASGVVTLHCVAKAGTRNRLRLDMSDYVSGDVSVTFDLTSGSIAIPAAGTPWTGPTAGISALGGGLYLCHLTATRNNTGTVAAGVFEIDNGTTSIYPGDGASGIYIANAQINLGPLQPYFYSPGPAPVVGAFYAQRTDYDPVTLACKGALIEAQSTNLLLNSAVPATQNITTTAQAYTVSMWGTGTCTLSGTATDVLTGTAANVRSSLTVTATAGTLTATFAGSNTNGQFEAGSLTSYIPTGAGTVVRVADTSSVGYDDLCKALPWLMDTNALTNPEDQTLWPKIGATAPNANIVALGTGNLTYSYKVSSTTGVVGAVWTGSMLLSGTPGAQCYLGMVEHGGSWPATVNLVTLTATPTIYTVTRTLIQNGDFDLRILDANQATTVTVGWAKLNPGPVAQTYYPQASKQGTIVFEGDLTYGSTTAAVLFCLENTVSNRVLLYKPTSGNTLYGYINGNGVNSNQVITSGVPFKAAIGFSLASAGIAANGSSESAITPGAFALAPNTLKIANDATNGGSGSVRIRRLRIFSTNLSASTKQSLTR